MDKRTERLKEELGEELCAYCPWKNDEIEHFPGTLCEGNYCNEALDAFLDDNDNYFDDFDDSDND